MGLLVKGGEVVTASARYTADVYAENETITHGSGAALILY